MGFNSKVKSNKAAGGALAGVAIVTITTPGDGYYMFDVSTVQVGTPDANYANAVLKVGGTVVGELLSTAVSTRLTGRIRVPAATDVTVNIGASAAGASAIYCATLSLTPIDGRSHS